MANDSGMGRGGLAARAGLETEDFLKRARDVLSRVEAEGIKDIRLVFCDQHGIARGKTVTAAALSGAFADGVGMTTTLLLKDTAHRTVFPVWDAGAGLGRPELAGAGDFVMVPDPSSFRILPWLAHAGWMQCDLFFADGAPVGFDTRRIGNQAAAALAEHGFGFTAGLEVEFHLLKLEDPSLRPGQAGQPADPPEVSLLTHGFQYLTELRGDEIEPITSQIARHVEALGLPLRTIETEFGPSQVEMTFAPLPGMRAADAMFLFRGAVKQIARRLGCHATFMCKPHIPDLFASGWHLHQSLTDLETGANVFSPSDDASLSDVGLSYLAGLLTHAAAASPFLVPTINGYKRYGPMKLAPDRIVWGRDNKGAMLRVVGGKDDPGTRIENRAGEPAANPYLAMAAQIHAGLDGIANARVPPPASETPYIDEDTAELPRSLMDAVTALDHSSLYRTVLGADMIDWFLTIKRTEISRFLSETTDWDQREYFEIF